MRFTIRIVVCGRLLDEPALMKSTRWNLMYQIAIPGRTGESEVPAQEHRAALEEQIIRLQDLVCRLLEKNERLRQRLATHREEE